MTGIDFFVAGVPVPQGSMKGFFRGGKIVITSANKNLGAWRQAVMFAAQSTGARIKPDTAISVIADFYLPRPKSVVQKILHPFRKPDLDKLIRALFDGITDAGVWDDDSRVCLVLAAKYYADESHPCGVSVLILERGDEDAAISKRFIA